MRSGPAILSAAATTAHLADFVGTVVVDPVVVWAPVGSWEGLHALVTALVAEPFERSALAAVCRSADVKKQPLLYVAAATLFPALCSQL